MHYFTFLAIVTVSLVYGFVSLIRIELLFMLIVFVNTEDNAGHSDDFQLKTNTCFEFNMLLTLGTLFFDYSDGFRHILYL